jgi:hypothetical protein
MLSSDLPPPVDEVQWHARRCAGGGATAVITMRRLKDLERGRSIVAFYGNAALGNRYLGCGTFHEYVSLTGDRGAAILRDSPLYSARGIPAGARAFLILRGCGRRGSTETLETRRGTVARTGRPPTLANIPCCVARAPVVCFRGGRCATGTAVARDA